MGAGAGMAIEDAATLTTLTETVRSKEDLKRVFDIYDVKRRERTQRLVKTSRDTGLLYDFELDKTGDSLERLAADTKERYRWVWEFDIEQAATAAKEKLRSEQS